MSEPACGPIGPFLASRIVGRGGSGVVYAASRAGGAEGPADLALKVLREDLALSDRERRKFVEEAELLRRVSDRSIIEVVDSGVLPDGRPYIAMPLLHGETLAARSARGPLPLAEALATFAMLAQAVAALHKCGLVHRDIKPENVFLEEGSGRPVLLDFGIAREVATGPSTTTEAGRLRGTPAYMAPERFFGVPASVATDIYELAVVLYAMLVARLPWSDDSGAAARLDPRFPPSATLALPAPVRAAILRALSTRPEARPGSVLELLAEIELARRSALLEDARTTSELHVESVDTHAMTEPPRAPAARRSRRSMVGAGLAALVAVAVVVFVGAPRGAGTGAAAVPVARTVVPVALPAPSEAAVARVAVTAAPPAEATAPALSESSAKAAGGGSRPTTPSHPSSSSARLYRDRK